MSVVQRIVLVSLCVLYNGFTCRAEDITCNGYEIIRNFGFENSIHTAWHTFPWQTAPNSSASKDGDYVNGVPCLGDTQGRMPTYLSWKHDGSAISFDLYGFKKVPPTFSRSFEWKDIEPIAETALTRIGAGSVILHVPIIYLEI